MTYKVLGTKKLFESKVFDYSRAKSYKNSEDIFRISPNSRSFKFLIHNDKKREIIIKEGIWEINKPLILPKDYILKASSKVSINLTNEIFFF